MGTRSPTGSSTDRRTSKTANLAKSSPTVSTTKCVRILKDSRRSGPIGVFVTTGASASRSAHEDDRTTRPHCWCLQEEGRLTSNLNFRERHFPGAIFSVFALVSVLFPSPSRMDVGARKDCFCSLGLFIVL